MDWNPKLKISEMVESANIAEIINRSEKGRNFLEKLGDTVVNEYQDDKTSRKPWEIKYANALKLALQVTEEKTFPFVGASNVKFPLLTIAAMRFHARAYPALIDSPSIVKTFIAGDDPDGKKAERAERISSHMNYQLFIEDVQWEEHMDRALFTLPIAGCVFKKTYFDSVAGINRSVLVLPQDLVVNYWTKDLRSASRITHVMQCEKNEIIEKQRSGIFLEGEISDPTQDPETDEVDTARDLSQGTHNSEIAHTQYVLLEQHRYVDLDGDGYKEPYIVTVREDTREVMRIVALYFDQDDVHRSNDSAIKRFEEVLHEIEAKIEVEKKSRGVIANAAAKIGLVDLVKDMEKQSSRIEKEIENLRSSADNKITRIDPIQYFTKIPFIPSPDGGFYDIGFGILAPINASVDTIINMLIDSDKMANLQAGFLSREIKLRKGSAAFEFGEYKQTEANAADLAKGIFPLPVRDPSPVLLKLLELLIGHAEIVGSSQDIMVGQSQGQNTPAETTRTNLEQGMKVFSAIYKRIYRAMSEELKKLKRLNELYLNESANYMNLTTGQGALITRDDYLKGDVWVIPEADPSIAGDGQRIQQADAVLAVSGKEPGFNRYEVTKRWLKAHRVQGIEQVYPNPKGPNAIPPMPNPKIEIEKMRMQSDQLDRDVKLKLGMLNLMQDAQLNQAKIQELEAKAIKALAEADGVDTGHQIALLNAQIGAAKQHQEGIMRALELMQNSISKKETEGGNKPDSASGMVSQPGDAGVSQ